MTTSKTSLALLTALSFQLAALGADEPSRFQTVWQIGRPDKSYAEFAIARNYGAFAGRFDRKPLVFEIGRSEAARDWPFIQPGPIDSWAGGRVHPFTIRFPLAAEPRGVYRLQVEFTDVHSGSPPTLLLTIGGRTGQFRLSAGGGDASLGNPAAGKPQKIELTLPRGLLPKGTNDIVLAATDGSWVLYDAVTLQQDPEGGTPEPDIETLTATATPFFIRQDGKTLRAIDVNVTLNTVGADVSLRVEAGGETTMVPSRG